MKQMYYLPTEKLTLTCKIGINSLQIKHGITKKNDINFQFLDHIFTTKKIKYPKYLNNINHYTGFLSTFLSLGLM